MGKVYPAPPAKVAAETLEVTTELALHWACHQAKRTVPRVGSAAHPTPWDVSHRDIDRLLDRCDKERASA